MKRRISILSYPVCWLLWDLLVVYIAYSLCRAIFLALNWSLYSGTLTWSHGLELFGAGLLFDTPAILYTNAVIMAMFLLPLHWKERSGYYRVARWIYTIVNSIAVYMNLMDCVYFPFTGKRTTASIFAEFSNESTGEMLKIFGGQFLSHWYLVLLAALVTWAFWKLFRPHRDAESCVSERVDNHEARLDIPTYYLVQVVSLLVAIPLCIGAIRGGFTKATRPITISNANQYVNRPAETGIVLNTPFSIFRTLKKTPFVVPEYMSDKEALTLYTPLHQPTDTAAFTPRNVVVIILESYGKQHIGFYNKTLRNGTFQGFTPFLDSLITQGAMTYRYSYSNGRKSIEGMPSVLSSLPNFVEPLFLTPASLNAMSGLARELGENKGYNTAFFHGAQNESMGFQAFARATGFQRYYGRDEYNADPNFHGDEDFDGTWAIWDEEFFQFFAQQMSQIQEPFMTALFSASSHDPFAIPEKYEGRFPKGERPLQQCIAYTDYALKRFFETASQQPWFNNTLFVITADHVNQQIDPFYCTTLGNYCVPIILYAPGDPSLHGYDEERVVEHIDIMPTVLAYLHYDKPYIAFGRNMLSGNANNGFALHWVPEYSGYEYVWGNYVLQFDGKDVTAAYKFRSDSTLTFNVLNSMPADTLQLMQRQMKSIIQQYMQRMNGDQLTVKH
ncbi:MAG: LTA synthase family protein [Muribaculaceae bacterium]|nr:LTA synthase family protein [Muribaculaceae bacterium]